MTIPALVAKDFKPEVAPDWCPGCGDFGVLTGLFQACADLQIQPHDLLVVSGIGCSSNLARFHPRIRRAQPSRSGAPLCDREQAGQPGDDRRRDRWRR